MKSPSELKVALETGAATTALVYRCAVDDSSARATLVLAHGAGAGQRSAFMVDFAAALSDMGVDVLTFNFPYTEQRRKIPDRAPVLEACYRAVILAAHEALDSARRALFVGGKSMGGRIATQVAAADATLPIAGVVLLGYPLHPPGKPTERRDKHLPSVRRPMLFVQGTRDAFGTPDELSPILAPLAPPATLHPVAQGDHSFKLLRRDPAAQAAVYVAIQRTIVAWVRAQAP
ncbi:MAG TPA: alpha/beta fold hydrolase [Vicinamibacterales bacterium]|nr:alpha/beta fold hydrolase [Vicinamibacterales bacterium]